MHASMCGYLYKISVDDGLHALYLFIDIQYTRIYDVYHHRNDNPFRKGIAYLHKDRHFDLSVCCASSSHHSVPFYPRALHTHIGKVERLHGPTPHRQREKYKQNGLQCRLMDVVLHYYTNT